MDVSDDWETWLEVELLKLLGKCADKADGSPYDAAGANVASAARAVLNRWDPFLSRL
jgi:hypothetical protein